jgi:exodeoxyribonuclease V alpha subunit
MLKFTLRAADRNLMAFKPVPMPRPDNVRSRLLEAVVQKQVFAKDDGFGIVKVFDVTSGQNATILGPVGKLAMSQNVRCEGAWDYDNKNGWQFLVTSVDQSLPEHRDAVKAWATKAKITLSEQTLARAAATWEASAPKVLQANPYMLMNVGLPFDEVDRLVSGRLKAKDPKVDSRRVAAAISHLVELAQEEGDTYLPRERGEAQLRELLGLAEDAPLGRPLAAASKRMGSRMHTDKQGWALARTQAVERKLADMLIERAQTPDLPVDRDKVIADAAAGGFQLSDEQADAVVSLHQHALASLTGGPGTGKTSCLVAALDSLDAAGTTYVLCSPTGKAAKRLEEATGRSASTVHSLLGYQYIIGRDDPKEIHAKVVLVDEVSMLDTEVAERLLAALRPDQRLVLVGDVDQLPSVGMGSVFNDVLSSGCGNVTRLTKTFRQGAGSLLLTNAQRVRDGVDPLWTVAEAEKAVGPVLADFEHLDTPDAASTAEAVFDYAQKHDDSLVISPQRAGVCGVYALNRLFQSRLNKEGETLFEACDGEETVRVGDRILVTENQKELGIANGETGTVLGMRDDVVTILVDGKRVELALPKAERILELGYVLTIHKSQGSQAHQVVCPLDPSTSGRMFSRNLVYTAWTRGQNACVVIGPKSAVRKALTVNGTERATGLAGMLREGLSHEVEPGMPTLSALEEPAAPAVAEAGEAPKLSAS